MEIKSINNHWNLYEIIQTENGITKLPSNYKENGKYKFLDYKNVYKKENICNFVYKNLPKINIFEKDIYFKYKSQKNSIAITWSSETNIDIFQASFISTDKPLILNGFCKIIKIKKEIPILPKWLTWYLNFNKYIQKIRRSIPYTTRCNMTINELKNIYIPKIDLYTQQAIINIIEPKEDLFLKYHKVVDITTLETFTSSWDNLINIIEPFENLNIFYLNKIRLLNNLKHRLGKKSFFSLEFNKFCFIKNCKGKIQQSKEGTYRYYNCSSNVSFIDNYNEYSNNDDLLIITTRGTITSHIIPRNTYFYATNNLMIFKGEGIHCFDYWFKNNKKSIISGTSIPMITKKDLNFLNFAYDKNIEELLQKINNLIFFFEKIKNIISIIIKKLIEIYIE